MKIILFCSGGYSTSLLVRKIEAEAKIKNKDILVEAHGVESIDRFGKKADVVLLGPQIRFRQHEISNFLKPIPVGVMDMQAYAMADGHAILNQAIDLFNSSKGK